MALRLAGRDARPLLASQFVRGWITVAMIGGALLFVGLALLTAVFAESIVPAVCGVAFGVCLLLTAVVVDGGWSGGKPGAIQRAAAAVVALAAVALAGYGVVVAETRFQQLPTIGTAPSHLGWPLAGAAIALLALSLMAVVLPLGRGGPSVARTAAVTALLGLTGAVASAVAFSSPSDAGCSRFDFETSRWQSALAAGGDELTHMAEAIDRCDVIPDGSSATRARALLGIAPTDRSTSWSWSVDEPAGFSFGTYLAIGLTADRERVEYVDYYVD